MAHPRAFAIGASLCAIIGVPTLIASFALNPGPPSGSSVAAMTAFGAAHHVGVLVGGWMQVMGTLLSVLFALAVVHMAGAANRLAGALTLFGATVLVCVGLAEMACYAALTSGDPTTVDVVSRLVTALQHAYPIVAAPMVFLPFSAVILASRVLPRVIGYLGLLLGAAFAVLGRMGMLAPVQGVVDALSAFQGLWWLAAAIALLASGKAGAEDGAASVNGLA